MCVCGGGGGVKGGRACSWCSIKFYLGNSVRRLNALHFSFASCPPYILSKTLYLIHIQTINMATLSFTLSIRNVFHNVYFRILIFLGA